LGVLEEKDSKKSQRGINFYISLAQKKAIFERKSGKQLLLFGALRENSPRRCQNDLSNPTS